MKRIRQEAKSPAKKPSVDPYKLAFAIRVATALKAFNTNRTKANELSQARLGELVAKRLKLAEPISQATVSRWMSETNPSIPDTRTIEAIADELETDPAWLAFGGTSRGRLENA